MRTKLLIGAVVLFAPAAAFAVPNVGGCGLGSKLFAGQSGIAPQVLAVTTNGWASQTGAITSGTSGCTQDGVVKSNWKTAMFIDRNANKLARDMSVGEGESLESLASLLEMQEGDKVLFFAESKANFSRIFPSEDVNSLQVITAIKQVLKENPQLAPYAKEI